MHRSISELNLLASSRPLVPAVTPAECPIAGVTLILTVWAGPAASPCAVRALSGVTHVLVTTP